MKIRNDKIKKLRKQGKTLDYLGNKYGITKERVRQICSNKKIKTYYCKKHNRKYIKECCFCKIDNHYNDVLERNGNIKDEIERLKIKSRKQEDVRKRKILVVKLVDEFNFTFRRIGQLLQKDHSTIIYLYNSYKNEKIGK